MKRKPGLKSIIIIVLTSIYLVLTFSKTRSNNRIFSENEKNIISNITISAKCIKVIDGDTIEVSILSDEISSLSQTEKIRFVGVNTPELNLHKKEDAEYFAQEAYLFTKKELENRYIKLTFDDVSSMRDRYGRLLCYVWVDEFCFNKILLEAGYARYYDNFKFNAKNMILFEKAENYAKINSMGMWNDGKQ